MEAATTRTGAARDRGTWGKDLKTTGPKSNRRMEMRQVKLAIRIGGAAIIAVACVTGTAAAQGAVDLETLQRFGTTEGLTASAQCVTPPLSCQECFYLDTYSPAHTTNAPDGNPWVLGPVYTNSVLASGQAYLITVSGDVSLWFQSVWTEAGAVSGTPGTYPAYPSQDTTNGNTGFDAECLFAFPGTFTVPQAFFGNQTISLNGGGAWQALPMMGGQSCHPDHVYRFLVEGQGQKLGFRYTDSGPTSDNSGEFKICVQKLIPCTNWYTSK